MAKMKEPKRTTEEIIAENQKLRETLDRIATAQTEGSDPIIGRYLKEIGKIHKKARVDTDKIQVVEITDHKNISLWTKEGKRIGPLHRDNALVAFKRFFDLGIILSVEQPTPDEIEAYKQTDEYKKAQAELAKIREIKEKSRRSGQLEKLAKEIAKMSGTTVEAINSILKANQIKSLSEGQEKAGVK